MELAFEICFYVGILLTLIGLLWLATSVARGGRSRIAAPLLMLLIGGSLILGPAAISRSMAIDLGPRESIVKRERHLSLTGWDGESYSFLASKPDTIVLQMGNSDVTDVTLDWLSGMTQLRELDLNDSNVTDVGLAKLAKLPSLQTLRLRGTRITDAGFREHLMNATSLKQIDLRQTSVSVDAVEQWKSSDADRRAFQ